MKNIKDFLKNLTGIDFFKLSLIDEKIKIRMKEIFIEDEEEYLRLLKSSKFEVDILLERIVNSTTFFFRELNLLKKILDVSKEFSNPKILCVGVSTGDEVYSLAILFEELEEEGRKYPQILGVDLVPGFVKKAQEGIFRASHLFLLTEELIKKYFTYHSSFLKIKEFKNVSFKTENIIFPSNELLLFKPNIVIIRNVLMYFTYEHRVLSLKNILRIIRSGYIFTSQGEIGIVKDIIFRFEPEYQIKPQIADNILFWKKE